MSSVHFSLTFCSDLKEFVLLNDSYVQKHSKMGW